MNDLDTHVAMLPASLVLRDAAAAAAYGDTDTPPAPIDPSAFLNVPGTGARVVDAGIAYAASPEAERDRQRARQEAEAEARAARIEAQVSRYLDAEAPADGELVIDTANLTPLRGRFVRFDAWLAQTRDKLAGIEAGIAEYRRQLGLPTEAEKRIATLIAEDEASFAAWVRSGAERLLKPLLRQQERDRLEAALVDARHEAQIAASAMPRLEEEREVLERAVHALEQRRGAFARDALVEVGATAAAAYADARDRLRAALIDLSALQQVAGHREALRDLGGFKEGFVSLPASMKPAEHEITAAAASWRDKLQRLIADPKAEFSSDRESAKTADSI